MGRAREGAEVRAATGSRDRSKRGHRRCLMKGAKMHLVKTNETVELPLIPNIVGDSAPMRQLLETVARVGPQDITVLVRGETGTGKELIASLIHAHSRRSAGPLVRFNCAAIPGELAGRNYSGTREAHLPAPIRRAKVSSLAQMAERWCSTKWVSSPSGYKPSFCAPCKRAKSSR